MKIRVAGGIILCGILLLAFAAMLYKMPQMSFEAREVSYSEFRSEISINYDILLLILCVILSIVMVASVFAFKISESIGGEK